MVRHWLGGIVPGCRGLLPIFANGQHLNKRRLCGRWLRVAYLVQSERRRTDDLIGRHGGDGKGDVIAGKTGPIGDIRLILNIKIGELAVVIAPGGVTPFTPIVKTAPTNGIPPYIGIANGGTVEVMANNGCAARGRTGGV